MKSETLLSAGDLQRLRTRHVTGRDPVPALAPCDYREMRDLKTSCHCRKQPWCTRSTPHTPVSDATCRHCQEGGIDWAAREADVK